ncbi:MAG TPA: hypothetical protein VFS77_13750 [Pyrinomonadaceae bacterium]|nr:hypothetical protein [Pyrinomonadaceae bacterium]
MAIVNAVAIAADPCFQKLNCASSATRRKTSSSALNELEALKQPFALLRVRDHGPGVPAEMLQQIFLRDISH